MRHVPPSGASDGGTFAFEAKRRGELHDHGGGTKRVGSDRRNATADAFPTPPRPTTGNAVTDPPASDPIPFHCPSNVAPPPRESNNRAGDNPPNAVPAG